MADLAARVKAEVAKMRPYLERSGAELQLVGVEDSIAKVVLVLTRPGSSRMVATLQLASGIERALRKAIPELRGVEAVNLPPHTLVGWDQPSYAPTDLESAVASARTTETRVPR
jgi:Fe-S cluster biogenesis protein NfuA